MPRTPVFPPRGIFRGSTAAISAGKWFDSNLMRWRAGSLQPVGGNAALSGYLMPTAGRDLLTWHDNKGFRWSACGTDTGLWAFSFESQTLYPVLTDLPALEPPGAFVGFGLADYGTDAYGTARDAADVGPSDISAVLGDQWSMDLFGEDLLIVPTQDGSLYRWYPTTPDLPAVLVPNAPTLNQGVLVTDERHVVLIGAGGSNRAVAWSDQENPEVWAAAVDNMAGDEQLETEGRPLTALRVVGGNLIFTDNDVHLMKYVGPPYAYGINKIGANCGPISRRAISQAALQTAWMGLQTFWQYNGSVVPMQCDVGDWLFSLINRDMIGRVFASPNPTFAEHWFFWPGEGSTECNRYVAVNYADPSAPWMIGLMDRTAADFKNAMLRPILAGPDGQVYIHEFGMTDNGASRVGQVYVETGDFTLVANGEARFHVTQIIEDFTGPANAMGYRFLIWEETDGPEYDTGLFPVINNSGRTDARFSCRGLRMRIEATADVPFAIGKTILLTTPGGSR
jgi:hypothetical protein